MSTGTQLTTPVALLERPPADPAYTPDTGPDPGLSALGPINTVTTSGGRPAASVAERVLGGTSALGLGVFIERGSGFLANILAARFGGASTFGAYSLGISTANQISTYAAGGIGATAARFSGKYPQGSPNYANLARALAVVSLFSALLAAMALWAGAGPIAHLLGKPELVSFLRWASLSAAGIILLECARGFFVGQRRLAALVLLSALVGGAMVVLLPAAARMHSPTRMIVLQGAITSGAVVLCLLLARPLGLLVQGVSRAGASGFAGILREVWRFGLVQLAGLVGSNLAGWWLTTLVARADTTLVQMSFFAIASQLRNLVGIAPSLLTEGSYAVMADPNGEDVRTPQRVMALCSFASLAVALVLASLGIVLVPWALTLLYGHTYAPAGLTVAIGLAIAVVHMGNAPAAARLTIVSIRTTGIINTVWAVFVAAAATVFLFVGGGAAAAMAIYFAAHVLSSVLVLLALRRLDHLPTGMLPLFSFSTLTALLLTVLACLRYALPQRAGMLTTAMTLLVVLAVALLLAFGRHFRWLPPRAAVVGLVGKLRSRLPGGRRRHV